MKENVIIGKLIPAGTGLKTYQDVEIDTQMPVFVPFLEKAAEVAGGSKRRRKAEADEDYNYDEEAIDDDSEDSDPEMSDEGMDGLEAFDSEAESDETFPETFASDTEDGTQTDVISLTDPSGTSDKKDETAWLFEEGQDEGKGKTAKKKKAVKSKAKSKSEQDIDEDEGDHIQDIPMTDNADSSDTDNDMD